MELRRALVEQTVADAGYRELVAVEHDSTVGEALHAMQAAGVGCILVLEDGHLRGIFTERDLVLRVLGTERSLEEPVQEHMMPEPHTARLDEPIHSALARMHAHHVRHLPVVNGEGTPVGTISVKRAVFFLRDHCPETVLNLPPDPGRYPATREGG